MRLKVSVSGPTPQPETRVGFARRLPVEADNYRLYRGYHERILMPTWLSVGKVILALF